MEQTAAETATTTVEKNDDDLLDSIINSTKAIRRETDRERVRRQLNQFFTDLNSGIMLTSSDAITSIENRIAEIDKLLSEQLSHILHHPEFQQLESSWLGLKNLVDCSETEQTQFKILNCTKKQLIKDFKTASDFDQSTLFKHIYESEYGTLGGIPFSAFVGDFEFDNTPDDLYLLEELSHVAAAAHAPFLSSINPAMLGLSAFSDLPKPRDMKKLFETTEYARWKRFRSSDDSRYVGLVLPRVIGRLPYSSKTIVAEQFCFEETVEEGNSNHYLWVNAAYSMASCLVSAFENYGWCVAIKGIEGGGLVQALPIYNYTSASGEKTFQCPTEVTISDRRERELSELGFIPLIYHKNSDYAVFFSAQSTNEPRVYASDIANTNANLSCQLQYILAISRFAHYLKVITREKIGSFTSKESCQSYLQSWLSQYVVNSDQADFEMKARYPLRQATVEVIENAGKSGSYSAVAYLKPHFQLEELSVSLRLVAELPNKS